MRDFISYDSEYNWYIRKINEHRVRCHISLDQLSEMTKISKSNLFKIFNYKIVPSVKCLIKILDALNLRIGLKHGYLYPFMLLI